MLLCFVRFECVSPIVVFCDKWICWRTVASFWTYPANTKHLYTICTTSDQRLCVCGFLIIIVYIVQSDNIYLVSLSFGKIYLIKYVDTITSQVPLVHVHKKKSQKSMTLPFEKLGAKLCICMREWLIAPWINYLPANHDNCRFNWF